MSDRFANLKKIRAEPAAKMLSHAGMKLQTELEGPASALVPDVMAELEDKKAIFDQILMMAIALPKREATWWGCLAARDLVGPEDEAAPRCLTTAEAWVFKPTDENREAVRVAMELADADDDTSLIALAAYYADGTMGVGDLAQTPAPPAAVPAAVMGINMKSLDKHVDEMDAHGTLLIDRALDIARGGSGNIKPAEPEGDA